MTRQREKTSNGAPGVWFRQAYPNGHSAWFPQRDPSGNFLADKMATHRGWNVGRRGFFVQRPARPCWHSTYDWLDPRYSCPPQHSASSRSDSSRSASSRSALGRSPARGRRRPAAARTGSSRSTASEVLSPTRAQPVVDPRSSARMKSRARDASAMDGATRA